MAIGVIKGSTVVAVVKELVEGTPMDPTLGSEFIPVLEDGLEIAPAKELIERAILTNSIGAEAPRTSTHSVTGSIPVEFRGAGVPGNAPAYGVLLESALGIKRAGQPQDTTSGLGSTTTLVSAAHTYKVGDLLHIQIPGAHQMSFVTKIIDVDTVEFSPPALAPVGAGMSISPSVTYEVANEGHPSLTVSVYWGNEIKEQGIGAKVSSVSLENFTTGQIPSLNFGFEGLDFDRVDGTAPVTPTYDPGMPPVVLGAVLSAGGDCIKVNEVTLSVENTIAYLTTICAPSGKIGSRYSARTVSGSFNPYLDDTTTEWFDKFKADTLFSLTLTLGIPSTTPGEYMPGSIVSIFLPSIMITEIPVADQDGILTEAIAFSANTGQAGETKEIYFSFA